MVNTKYISSQVIRLINKYKTRNPFELCNEMNINVRYMDLGKELKAYFFYHSRISNIVINQNVSEIAGKILCAHELGHAVLHKKISTMKGFHEIGLFDTVIPTEYEANLFSAELLIDDEILLEKLNEKDTSFFEIAQELCVPSELLDFKFRIFKNKGCHIEPPYISNADFLKNKIDGFFD